MTTVLYPAFRRYSENPANPYRLGRHQMHDVLDAMPEREAERSLDLLKPIRTVTHVEHEPCFDQGQLGSCTANAAFGTRVTGTDEEWAAFLAVWAKFTGGRDSVVEDDCVALYQVETRLDDSQIPGEYPPDDTGSSGPWSMLALEKDGLIRSFTHTRRVHTALVALNTAAISIGVPWYQSMFQPDASGRVVVDESSGLAGGHQVCVVANDISARLVTIRNSWGTSWGDAGHATLSWDDLTTLFRQGGDAVQPVAA
jgi:hypothetical protein